MATFADLLLGTTSVAELGHTHRCRPIIRPIHLIPAFQPFRSHHTILRSPLVPRVLRHPATSGRPQLTPTATLDSGIATCCRCCPERGRGAWLGTTGRICVSKVFCRVLCPGRGGGAVGGAVVGTGGWAADQHVCGKQEGELLP